MTIESATRIGQLNATYPANADIKSEGDDHLRLIKLCLLNSFPVDCRNMTNIYSQMTGQNVRYDGTSLNFNVRARYGKWQSTVAQTIPITTPDTFVFSSTPVENGFGHVYGSNKLTVANSTKYLAFRLSGTVRILAPDGGDYIEIRVRKNSNTAVAGPFKFYPGINNGGEDYVFSNFDIFQVIPESGLVSTDAFYIDIKYVPNSGTPAVKEFMAGTVLEIYDQG